VWIMGFSYRRSSGLPNFLGFFGQQSQMNSPLIFEVWGFGVFKAVGIGTLPVASVAGGSRVEPVTTLGIGWTSWTGELGFKIDFSWNVSRSELGESPPGDGRSYGERLVMLLPPIERVDE
jgi:hypothetical protein